MSLHCQHFGAFERNFIQSQLNTGATQATISVAPCPSRSSVSREVCSYKVNASRPGTGYDAACASAASCLLRRRGPLRLAEGIALRAAVFGQIRLGWSPQ